MKVYPTFFYILAFALCLMSNNQVFCQSIGSAPHLEKNREAVQEFCDELAKRLIDTDNKWIVSKIATEQELLAAYKNVLKDRGIKPSKEFEQKLKDIRNKNRMLFIKSVYASFPDYGQLKPKDTYEILDKNAYQLNSPRNYIQNNILTVGIDIDVFYLEPISLILNEQDEIKIVPYPFNMKINAETDSDYAISSATKEDEILSDYPYEEGILTTKKIARLFPENSENSLQTKVDKQEYTSQYGDKTLVEAPKPPAQNNEVFLDTEQSAEFPGGEKALMSWIANQIEYPEIALANKLRGIVYVEFIVNQDGSIEQEKIVRDIGGGCGAEAIRIVKKMPKWKPAKHNGVTVRSYFTLPITFELPE